MTSKAERVELIHVKLIADFNCVPELEVEVYSDEFPYERAEGVVYKNRLGKGVRSMKQVVRLGDMWTEIVESATPRWIAHCIYERGVSDEQLGETIARMAMTVKSALAMSARNFAKAVENIRDLSPEECVALYREKAPIGESGSPEIEDGYACPESELAFDIFNEATYNGEEVCRARGIDKQLWYGCITSLVTKDETRKAARAYHSRWAGEYAIFPSKEEKEKFVSSLAVKFSGDCLTKFFAVIDANGGKLPEKLAEQARDVIPVPKNSTVEEHADAMPVPRAASNEPME